MLHVPAEPRLQPADTEDAFVYLRGVSWADFETILAIRGDASRPRIAYLDGVLEFMSPTSNHEAIKTCLARLVEAYGEEAGLELNGFGSWTLKVALAKAGVEPDECYVLDGPKNVPDLAIEIELTSGSLDKVEIYRRLGVAELWRWTKGRIEVRHLVAGQYELIGRSAIFPALDLSLLERLCVYTSQPTAVRELRQALRAETP
ncbi:MAG: Uma2 family endonuclease [Myxococcales bacterium]|nr:Uma2 family endonuclease [Myxococcales bacterium]